MTGAEGQARGYLGVPRGNSKGPDLSSGPRDTYGGGVVAGKSGDRWRWLLWKLGHQQSLVSVQVEGNVSLWKETEFFICPMGTTMPVFRLARMPRMAWRGLACCAHMRGVSAWVPVWLSRLPFAERLESVTGCLFNSLETLLPAIS